MTTTRAQLCLTAAMAMLVATASFGQHRFTPLPEGSFQWKPFREGIRAVAVADVDNDGWLDAVATSVHDTRHALFHSESGARFVDVGGRIAPDVAAGWKGGPALADYDNDGDLDLFIAQGDFGDPDVNLLLRNDRGRFVDVTAEAGLADVDLPPYSSDIPSLSPVSMWLDFDRDGFVDLYVGSLGADRLYRNRGDGTFSDVTEAAGLAGVFSVGSCLATDVNGDGWPDLYLAVAEGANRLFVNDEGTFIEATPEGLASTQFSWLASSGDVDGDGDFDLCQANTHSVPLADDRAGVTQLFLNDGDGRWRIRDGFGIGTYQSCLLEDTDGDGDLDVHTTWRRSTRHYLFENRALDFLEVDATAPAGLIALASAFGDYDLDGSPDLWLGGPHVMLRNEPQGSQWLYVELVGTQSNRSAIGAVATVVAGRLRSVREVSGGRGPSQDELALHFGLDVEAFVDSLIVDWPSGARDVLLDVPPRQRIRVIEGAGQWHGVQPTRWLVPPPDTLVAGVTVDVQVAVRPALYDAGSRIDSVVVDASRLGASAVALTRDADGSYAGQVPITVDRNGFRELSVFIDQQTSLGPHWIRLSRRLVVVPGQDLVILDDLGPPGWTATASRTESFDLQGATPFRGASAAELRAEPSFGGWSLVMRPQEPLATVGYDSLTMALRVHELELPGGPRLTVSASPGPPVSLLDGLLDPDSREWQRVALALGELELEDTLESVSVAGNVRVHLDVDDVRLVSRLQVAANTAVTESFDDTRPADVGLDASYPNPFNSSTVIPFQLPTDAEVDLALFDIVGQRVATLVAGHRRAGLHRAVWDGRDQQDKPLASGVYIVRLNTGGRVEHRKLALLR